MDLEGILRGFVCRGAFCHSGCPSAHLGLCAKGGHTLGRLEQALSPTFRGAAAKSTGSQARARTCKQALACRQRSDQRASFEIQQARRSATYSEANIEPRLCPSCLLLCVRGCILFAHVSGWGGELHTGILC